jgi:DNA-binding transcriptional LysR family regulator
MTDEDTETVLRLLSAVERRRVRRKGILTIVCDSAPVLATVVQQSDCLALLYLFLIEDDLRAGRIRALPDPSRHSSTRCASTTTTWRSATLRYSPSLRRHDQSTNAPVTHFKRCAASGIARAVEI